MKVQRVQRSHNATAPNRAIREWALSKGIEVSDRGRIRSDLVERYHAEAGH
ncbi:histone-like nucleoid-structuring protein Lsr2 [Dactylosporangium cerinum]|uniref:Histone-like nucleoid-structuring protein Lsr2 n=1 Tax=Dactylosporangium cerinum TaxID=1434730 RepID=A0ABV9W8W3_9ACTN